MPLTRIVYGDNAGYLKILHLNTDTREEPSRPHDGELTYREKMGVNPMVIVKGKDKDDFIIGFKNGYVATLRVPEPVQGGERLLYPDPSWRREVKVSKTGIIALYYDADEDCLDVVDRDMNWYRLFWGKSVKQESNESSEKDIKDENSPSEEMELIGCNDEDDNKIKNKNKEVDEKVPKKEELDGEEEQEDEEDEEDEEEEEEEEEYTMEKITLYRKPTRITCCSFIGKGLLALGVNQQGAIVYQYPRLKLEGQVSKSIAKMHKQMAPTDAPCYYKANWEIHNAYGQTSKVLISAVCGCYTPTTIIKEEGKNESGQATTTTNILAYGDIMGRVHIHTRDEAKTLPSDLFQIDSARRHKVFTGPTNTVQCNQLRVCQSVRADELDTQQQRNAQRAKVNTANGTGRGFKYALNIVSAQPHPHEERLAALKTISSPTLLLCANSYGCLRLIDIDGTVIKTYVGISGSVVSLSDTRADGLEPTETLIAAACLDCFIRVYNVMEAKPRRAVFTTNPPTCLFMDTIDVISIEEEEEEEEEYKVKEEENEMENDNIKNEIIENSELSGQYEVFADSESESDIDNNNDDNEEDSSSPHNTTTATTTTTTPARKQPQRHPPKRRRKLRRGKRGSQK